MRGHAEGVTDGHNAVKVMFIPPLDTLFSTYLHAYLCIALIDEVYMDECLYVIIGLNKRIYSVILRIINFVIHK